MYRRIKISRSISRSSHQIGRNGQDSLGQGHQSIITNDRGQNADSDKSRSGVAGSSSDGNILGGTIDDSADESHGIAGTEFLDGTSVNPDTDGRTGVSTVEDNGPSTGPKNNRRNSHRGNRVPGGNSRPQRFDRNPIDSRLRNGRFNGARDAPNGVRSRRAGRDGIMPEGGSGPFENRRIGTDIASGDEPEAFGSGRDGFVNGDASSGGRNTDRDGSSARNPWSYSTDGSLNGADASIGGNLQLGQ